MPFTGGGGAVVNNVYPYTLTSPVLTQRAFIFGLVMVLVVVVVVVVVGGASLAMEFGEVYDGFREYTYPGLLACPVTLWVGEGSCITAS